MRVADPRGAKVVAERHRAVDGKVDLAIFGAAIRGDRTDRCGGQVHRRDCDDDEKREPGKTTHTGSSTGWWPR